MTHTQPNPIYRVIDMIQPYPFHCALQYQHQVYCMFSSWLYAVTKILGRIVIIIGLLVIPALRIPTQSGNRSARVQLCFSNPWSKPRPSCSLINCVVLNLTVAVTYFKSRYFSLFYTGNYMGYGIFHCFVEPFIGLCYCVALYLICYYQNLFSN